MKFLFKILAFLSWPFILNNALASGAQGDVEGHAVVLGLKTENVQRLIRPEYELVPQSVTAPGTHPLLLLFFNFKKVRPTFAGKLVMGMNYKSLYVLVPYAKLKNTQGRVPNEQYYSVLPTGLMSSRLMLFMSRKYSGLEKKHASVQWRTDSFTASNGNGHLISAQFKTDHRRLAFDIGQIKKMIDTPILSDRPIGSLNFGSSKASINWDKAKLSPETVTLEIAELFLSGLGESHFSIESIIDQPLGAFHFTAPFHVGNFSNF